MKPAEIDLTIYKGSTFSKTFQWKTGTPATPVNLTGCSLRMQIRKTAKSSTVLAEFTSENAKLYFVDAASGIFKLDISATESSEFTFSEGVYSIEVVYPDGIVVYRLIQGSIIAESEVTRE
jgi:hypothetical protein